MRNYASNKRIEDYTLNISHKYTHTCALTHTHTYTHMVIVNVIAIVIKQFVKRRSDTQMRTRISTQDSAATNKHDRIRIRIFVY